MENVYKMALDKKKPLIGLTHCKVTVWSTVHHMGPSTCNKEEWAMTTRAATLLLLLSVIALNLAAADTVGSRVIGGTDGLASDFPEVVRIQTTGGAVLFTGTLISPQHVLTAASAVTDAGGNITFTSATGVAVIGGQTYTIASAIKNPNWTGTNGGTFTTGNPDIAILVLNQRVTTVRPAPIYRQTPLANQPLILAGFGVTGDTTNGETGGSPLPGHIVSGPEIIQTVAPDYYSWTLTSTQADTASGESGAPSFILSNGTRYVSGL